MWRKVSCLAGVVREHVDLVPIDTCYLRAQEVLASSLSLFAGDALALGRHVLDVSFLELNGLGEEDLGLGGFTNMD